MRRTAILAGVFLGLTAARGAAGADFPNPLPVEPIGRSLTAPASLPASWAFVNTIDSIELIDTTAKSPDHVRGALGPSNFTLMALSRTRPEAYTADTFYSRGTRGVRTDVVTIWDTASLAPKGEIVLQGAHRYLSAPQPNAFQLSGDESLGFVFSFTPAGAVKVLDLAARKQLSETPIPGCALIYPTGARGFSTLCGSGTMLSVQLDAAGKVIGQSETKAFNDLTNDPLFSYPARLGAVSYFVSYNGQVQPVDLSGPAAKVLDRWSLVTPDEAKANWRPSGWQLAAGGPDGRLYVIMQPNGRDGSHKDGGPEVWVFDPATHAKVATIKLRVSSDCIAVSGGTHPMLLVSSLSPDSPLDVSLDTYELSGGPAVNTAPLHFLGGPPVIFPVGR
jgi:methylamine dehydrogenase heavy chain